MHYLNAFVLQEQLAKVLGFEYALLSVRYANDIDDNYAEQLWALLDKMPKPILLHCAVGYISVLTQTSLPWIFIVRMGYICLVVYATVEIAAYCASSTVAAFFFLSGSQLCRLCAAGMACIYVAKDMPEATAQNVAVRSPLRPLLFAFLTAVTGVGTILLMFDCVRLHLLSHVPLLSPLCHRGGII